MMNNNIVSVGTGNDGGLEADYFYRFLLKNADNDDKLRELMLGYTRKKLKEQRQEAIDNIKYRDLRTAIQETVRKNMYESMDRMIFGMKTNEH